MSKAQHRKFKGLPTRSAFKGARGPLVLVMRSLTRGDDANANARQSGLE